MTFTARTCSLAVALCLALATPAWTQNDRAPASERGTELDGLVGAASTDTHTGPFVAGIATWRLTGKVRAEARGAWFARGSGADAFAADIGGAVNLTRWRNMAPYVGAAVGLYRATFDTASAPMSAFYRQRLEQAMTAGREHVFTDPSVRVSAGVDWRIGARLSLRPEASALVVRRDGRGETLALVGVRIGYRFEDRPVTP